LIAACILILKSNVDKMGQFVQIGENKSDIRDPMAAEKSCSSSHSMIGEVPGQAVANREWANCSNG
jgi:hypothetical protein